MNSIEQSGFIPSNLTNLNKYNVHIYDKDEYTLIYNKQEDNYKLFKYCNVKPIWTKTEFVLSTKNYNNILNLLINK